MKILHTSDWHLGMTAGNTSLEEDQRFFLQQLYTIIKDEKVDAVLCAGDIYDSSVSNADAIYLPDLYQLQIMLKHYVHEYIHMLL